MNVCGTNEVLELRSLSYYGCRVVDTPSSPTIVLLTGEPSWYCQDVGQRATQSQKRINNSSLTCPLTCSSRSERFANRSPSMCNNDCPLGQIFSFLEPLDLLCLSRTTKVLRAFLLSRRRSSALWKIAISNVKGFPPCPDHMSAPAYTHLAFVPVCHVSRPPYYCACS